MKIYSLKSNSQALDGGAMFGNAPKAMWSKWVKCDGENRITLSTQCILIETKENGKENTKGEKYLFECGIGAFFEEKLRIRYGIQEKEHVLLHSLEKMGVKPEEITHIVLSHLHFDHAGGILEAFDSSDPKKNLNIVFPKAKIFISREQMERALSPHSRDRASFIPELMVQLKDNPQVFLIDADPQCPVKKKELPSWLEFVFSHGHTPGLMISGISFPQGKKIYYPSDLIPGIPWIHVPISMGYDRFPELVIDEKRKFLEKVYEEKSYLYFVHDEEFVACKIDYIKDGKHGKFVPDLNSRLKEIQGNLPN